MITLTTYMLWKQVREARIQSGTSVLHNEMRAGSFPGWRSIRNLHSLGGMLSWLLFLLWQQQIMPWARHTCREALHLWNTSRKLLRNFYMKNGYPSTWLFLSALVSDSSKGRFKGGKSRKSCDWLWEWLCGGPGKLTAQSLAMRAFQETQPSRKCVPSRYV